MRFTLGLIIGFIWCFLSVIWSDDDTFSWIQRVREWFHDITKY